MIDEILTPFYEDCKPKPCEFGHLFLTATEYPPEELQLWRPTEYDNDVAKSYATTFEITKPKNDAFKRKYPLSNPRLKTNEEFIVSRSKPRPVVLIIPPMTINVPQEKGKGRIWRPLCLVAPMFSLEFPHTGEEKYPGEFIEQVRRLEFPQLMFTPKYKDSKVDGILRLDEMQSVSINSLRPLEISLTDPVKKLLRSQILFLMTKFYDGDYAVYRDCIRAGLA